MTTLATDKKMAANGTSKYMNGNESHLKNFENQINLTNGNRIQVKGTELTVFQNVIISSEKQKHKPQAVGPDS